MGKFCLQRLYGRKDHVVGFSRGKPRGEFGPQFLRLKEKPALTFAVSERI